MIQEPHTTDEHDFGEDCQDCAALCAGALEELVQWLASTPHRPKSFRVKSAALAVVTKQMTASEACDVFGIRQPKNIYRRVKELSLMFGLKYKHGKVL